MPPLARAKLTARASRTRLAIELAMACASALMDTPGKRPAFRVTLSVEMATLLPTRSATMETPITTTTAQMTVRNWTAHPSQMDLSSAAASWVE